MSKASRHGKTNAPSDKPRFGMVPRGAALDPELAKSAIALRVFILLCSYADEHGGSCYPRQGTIASELGVRASRVSEAIALLERRGWVKKIAGTRTTGYEYQINHRQFPAERKIKARPEVPPQRKSTSAVPEVQTSAVAEELYKEQTKITDHLTNHPPAIPPARSAKHAAIEPVVEEFWRQFPAQRRVNKAGVAKKIRQLIASGEVSHDELIGGVLRYATSDDVARGYACMPMTWLNQRRWEHEPVRAQLNGSAASGGLLAALRRRAIRRDDQTSEDHNHAGDR